MPRIEKSTVIRASADKIFDVLADPTRASDVNTDLKLLSFTPSAVGGYDNKWEYKMGGLKFSGETKIRAFEKPNHLVWETTGGIPSHWDWRLEPQDGATRVSITLDYSLPGAFLGDLMNKVFVERQNQKAIEDQLSNLKRLAESG